MGSIKLQDIINDHVDELKESVSFPVYIHKALGSLGYCRTAVLGGHAQYCEKGHLNGVWYNSCKHRSCPQCRSVPTENWLRSTQSMILDCAHHHLVFTIPSDLHRLWRYNRELLTNILFKSVKDTLKKFSSNPKYLNATPAMITALHTWGRDLSLHPHLHVVISHGGLSSEGYWVNPRKKHLYPQKPTMMIYRGKFLALLKAALIRGDLKLPASLEEHKVQSLFNRLGRQDWVVHYSKRYKHARGVVRYLGRYVKGGPFKNNQLKYVTKDKVTFQYKSHKSRRVERQTLSVKAFLLRLLEHVPLPNKPTVRYGGLYVNSCRDRLNRARKHFAQSVVKKPEPLSWEEYMLLNGKQPLCKVCGLPLSHKEEVGRIFEA